MDKLNILWTTGDKDTFNHMIAMYSLNSMKSGWWDAVNIIIWGASTRLSGEDTDVQKNLQNLIDMGTLVVISSLWTESLSSGRLEHKIPLLGSMFPEKFEFDSEKY